MSGKLSLKRTIVDSFSSVPANLMQSPVGAVAFVLLGVALSYASRPLGNDAPYLVAFGALILWCLWEGQIHSPAPKAFPVPDRGSLMVLASTVAFLPVLLFAIVLALAVAAFFAGSVLTVLEIDPDTLNWTEDSLQKNLELLGQEGTAVVILSTVAAFSVPFAILLRTSAHRPLAVMEKRFVVFEPGGWSRGSTWSLIGAGIVAILLPFAFAIYMASTAPIGYGLLRVVAGWLALALALLVFAGFCRSVLDQTRPNETPGAAAS